MLEGKMFFPEVGMPMANSALNRVLLDVAEPEPLMVPIVIQKSLTISSISLGLLVVLAIFGKDLLLFKLLFQFTLFYKLY